MANADACTLPLHRQPKYYGIPPLVVLIGYGHEREQQSVHQDTRGSNQGRIQALRTL